MKRRSRFWLALFSVAILGGGCHSMAAKPSTDRATTGQPKGGTLALLGAEAAKITTTRIGDNGSGDAGLAKALNVSNQPGQALGEGVYAPSQMELALHALFKKERRYQRLSSMLNPYEEQSPKANGAFSVDFSRTTVTEVEFIPGRKRRSYFIELGISFTLLDSRGRTAFTTEVMNYELHYCIIEHKGGPCTHALTLQPFDLASIWDDLLKNTMDQMMEKTLAGLQQWDELLRHLTARVVLKRFGEQLKLKKNAAFIRNRELAGYPYLFLQVPRVRSEKLIEALREHGVTLDQKQQARLVDYATVIFRNELERQLRNQLAASRSSRQAAIFVLPDKSAIWFQDALARIVTDAVNAEEYEIVMKDDGTRRELAKDIRNFGRLCNKKSARRNSDRCMGILSQFTKIKTLKPGKRLKETTKAMQLVSVLGLIRDIHINPKSDPNKDRFMPHSIADPRKRFVRESTKSTEYERIESADAGDNDDGFYLKRTAFDAMEKLASKMSENVIKTFEEEMLD